jgi:hypothetical protein
MSNTSRVSLFNSCRVVARRRRAPIPTRREEDDVTSGSGCSDEIIFR